MCGIHGAEAPREPNVVIEGHCCLHFLVIAQWMDIFFEQVLADYMCDIFHGIADRFRTHAGMVNIIENCHSSAKHLQHWQEFVVYWYVMVTATAGLLMAAIQVGCSLQDFTFQFFIGRGGNPVSVSEVALTSHLSHRIVETVTDVPLYCGLAIVWGGSQSIATQLAAKLLWCKD